MPRIARLGGQLRVRQGGRAVGGAAPAAREGHAGHGEAEVREAAQGKREGVESIRGGGGETERGEI